MRMSSPHMIAAAREVEEGSRTIWVRTGKSWLWSKTKDIVNTKVPVKFARHIGIEG